MARIKSLTAKAEADSKYRVPHRIYDVETKPSKKSRQKIAEGMLKKIARELKIRPDLSQLKFDKVKDSILGTHVLYQQYHAGKPISGAWIRVDIDQEGRVYNIHSDLVPEPAMAKARKIDARIAEETRPKLLSANQAISRAIEAAAAGPGDSVKVLHNEQVYYPKDDVPVLTWKVIVKTTPQKSRTKGRPAEWKMPVVTLNDTSSRQGLYGSCF